ncbi:MAG: hypothetical protein ACE5JG_09625 [Planctomycetota bacterium]
MPRAAELLQGAGEGGIAAVASPFMTNEELFALRRICDALGVERRRFLEPVGEGDDLLVHRQKCPNSRGAARMGFTAADGEWGEGEIGVLLYVSPREGTGLPAEVEARARRRIVFSLHEREADVSFPLTSWIEKDGTVISAGDRLQRLRKGMVRFPGLVTERVVLERLLGALDPAAVPAQTPAHAFQRMAAATEGLGGLGWNDVGALGVALPAQEAPA